MNMKEAMEKRKAAYDKMHELRDTMKTEERDLLTVEERTAWDEANADFDKFDKVVADEKRMQEIEGRISEPSDPAKPGREDRGMETSGTEQPITDETRALAMQGWARFQMQGEVRDDQKAAMERVGLSPHRKELRWNLASRQARTMEEIEKRALSTTATEGGDTIPEGFVNQLEKNMLFYGGILGNIDVLRTTTGQDLPMATFDDTSNKAVKIAEAGDASSGTDPDTDVIVWKAHKYTTKVIKVNQELLEDSAFNMVQILSEAFGERFGRAINSDCTDGSAADEIQGILDEGTLGKTFASATAITLNEVLDLIHSVDPAYRNGAKFMLNDSTIKLLRKLKDDQGQYLWTPSVQAGEPSQLWNYPVITNNDMPTAAATNKALAFGNFSFYRLRQVLDMRMYRLVERYREYDQDGFVAFMRMDGHIRNAGTNPIAYGQMAAGS